MKFKDFKKLITEFESHLGNIDDYEIHVNTNCSNNYNDWNVEKLKNISIGKVEEIYTIELHGDSFKFKD